MVRGLIGPRRRRALQDQILEHLGAQAGEVFIEGGFDRGEGRLRLAGPGEEACDGAKCLGLARTQLVSRNRFVFCVLPFLLLDEDEGFRRVTARLPRSFADAG